MNALDSARAYLASVASYMTDVACELAGYLGQRLCSNPELQAHVVDAVSYALGFVCLTRSKLLEAAAALGVVQDQLEALEVPR